MKVCTPLLALGLAACLAGCKGNDFIAADQGIAGYEAGAGPCKEGEKLCSANKLLVCTDGQLQPKLACQAPEICSQTLGACAACEPGQATCVGDEIHSCDAKGQLGALQKTCPAGSCAGGLCVDACSQAASKRSYIGCSYWPTVTINSALVADFNFAVVVANAQAQKATVTVSTATNPSVATAEVAPNSTATIKLPWVMSLKQDSAVGPDVSVQDNQGAYHLVSSVPVTAYQFNALEYVLGHDCTKGNDITPGDGKCYSYTNDASLLLPENALYNEYIVLSRPSMFTKVPDGLAQIKVPSPGFFTVTAVKPGTTTVRIGFTSDTQAGSGGLAAYHKGQTAEFKLPQHAVLEIVSAVPADCAPSTSDPQGFYCDLADLDLTGTRIIADQDIAVFAGHNCSFVPYNKWACDHLEEQMFPVKSWGKRYIASQTISSKDPSVYRVVSADKGNTITFTPAVQAPVTLDEGKFIELTTDQDFEVTGTGRFALVQFMVGQNYSGSTADAAPGDPSMSLAVPVEQYRKSYNFLAPETYDQSYVNITAPAAAEVRLDGAPIAPTAFAPLGSSGYKLAKLKIGGGSHAIESTIEVGISVYGVGSYTSYMYPGGLDLKLLLY